MLGKEVDRGKGGRIFGGKLLGTEMGGNNFILVKILSDICLYVYACVFVHLYTWLQVPQEGIGSSSAGLIGYCESLDVVAGN